MAILAFTKIERVAAYFSGMFSVIIFAKITFIEPPAIPKSTLPIVRKTTEPAMVTRELTIASS